MSARARILPVDRLAGVLASHRRAGRRVVLTNGGFDLLHVGHVRMLEEAATLGGVLVVAVNDDASLRTLKGAGRPLVPAVERAELVAALQCVDYVTIFAGTTVDRLLETLRPDVHAKGRDYTSDTIPERPTSEALGIETAIVGDAKVRSSTGMLARASVAAAEPVDRVRPLGLADARGFALREGARVLRASGWLDLRRLVTTQEGAVVSRRPARFLRRIEVGGHPLYVKVAWPAPRRLSAIVEFQNHLALRAAGFRAPEPWLCMEGRLDGREATVLVTREAPGLALDEYLALGLPQASPRERLAMARGLGSTLRGLHTARFFPPDLEARHILVEGSAAAGRRALTFLDLQRMDRGGTLLRRKKAAEGLAALALSLRSVAPPRVRLAVLRAYLGGTLQASRPWIEAVRRAVARLDRRGGLPRRGGEPRGAQRGAGAAAP